MLDGIRPKRSKKVVSHKLLAQGSKKSVFKKLKLTFDFKKVFTACLILLLVGTVFTAFAYSSLKSVEDSVDLLGLAKSGKFLILFQNNTEARATGGFIGSFAVADIEYGKITNLEIDTNIYKRDHEYDYQLKQTAPEPLNSWLKNQEYAYWAMRDSNWAIDFSEAAKQIAWFYEQEGGTKVDGVVAVNATVVRDLLNLTGPINLPQYNQIITPENFFTVLHEQIEKKYFETEENIAINEPKTILKDMYSQLMQKVTAPEFQDQLISFVTDQLNKKEIMLNFNNSGLQYIAKTAGWSGEIEETNTDFLHVNNSNLGGQKSSLNVTQDIKLDSSLSKGKRINKLTIIRSHIGDGQWPDSDNKNYMRILVPKGAELLSAKMDNENILAKINQGYEAQKTAFGLWYTTNVGQTKILTIEYQLPEELATENSQIMLQKQSGALNTQVEVIVDNMVKHRGSLEQDVLVN